MEEKVKFLTVKEVASVLRVSATTVRTMVQRGDIGAMQSGRTIRIPETELDRIIRESQTPKSGNNP